MAQTDNPLKRLVEAAITDFAAWLLETDVQEVVTVNVELASATVRVDQLFRVTLATGRRTLLHIEFQGKSTHRPMKWRMLDYMTHISGAEPDLDLLSVVFYVGYGAGANDRGEHQISAPDGMASLHWRYRVIHLWRMSAQELVALNRIGLLPLVGQTQIEQPEQILPQIVEQIKQSPDREFQGRLFASLLALISDEEMVKMLEKMIEEEELLLDTPYLRRLREKALREGSEEGLEQGLEQGLTQGRIEGALMTRRQDTLDALTWRFDPSASIYREVEKVLAQIDDNAELERLFAAVIRAQTVDEFRAALPTTNGSSTLKTV